MTSLSILRLRSDIPALITALAMLALLSSAGAQDTREIGFQGYPEAPEFTVVPRKEKLTWYPCEQCHEFMEPNPTVRELAAPHEIELNHGGGRIWCITCHATDNRNTLTTPLGEPVDFDDAHIVCGTCHGNRHRDWHFGGHGKRVTHWQGERELYNCTHCHDAHNPSIKPREPQPPPDVRVGLEKPATPSHDFERVWENHQDESREDTAHE